MGDLGLRVNSQDNQFKDPFGFLGNRNIAHFLHDVTKNYPLCSVISPTLIANVEAQILSAIQFAACPPCPNEMLQALLQMHKIPLNSGIFYTASYLFQSTLVDPQMLNYLPSLKVEAAFYLALLIHVFEEAGTPAQHQDQDFNFILGSRSSGSVSAGDNMEVMDVEALSVAGGIMLVALDDVETEMARRL